MDRVITASEANQRFAELLRDVASGDSFTVMSQGKPVARIAPVEDVAGRRRAALESLLELSRSMPVRISGPWTREDLYR